MATSESAARRRMARRQDNEEQVSWPALEAAAARGGTQRRDNADLLAFFREQLWLIKGRTYDRKFPQLRAKEFIPLDSEIDEATEEIKVRSYDQVGVAKIIQAYSDDLPRADISASEDTHKVVSTGVSYGWSLAEVRAASKAGRSLDQSKAAAARRAIAILHDRILSLGDTAHGIRGLLNQANASTYVIPPGGGGSTTWALKTSQEIVDDMIGICESIFITTNENEMPNMLLMPRAQFTRIRTQRYDVNSDVTVLQWFQRVYPGVGVDYWSRMSGAGAGGTDRLMAYTMSPEHLQGIEPMPFRQHPAEPHNLTITVPCEGRVGGVMAYYPLAIAYGDGV